MRFNDWSISLIEHQGMDVLVHEEQSLVKLETGGKHPQGTQGKERYVHRVDGSTASQDVDHVCAEQNQDQYSENHQQRAMVPACVGAPIHWRRAGHAASLTATGSTA